MKVIPLYIFLLFCFGYSVIGESRIVVEEYIATETDISAEFVGSLESANTTRLKSKVDGRVDKLHVKDGEFIKMGGGVVSLEREHLLAELKRANVFLKEALYHYETTWLLFKKGFVTKPALLNVRSKLYAIAADAKRTKEQLINKTVVAPFDGYINKLQVRQGDYLSVRGNDAIGTFFSSDFIARVSVPEAFINKVNKVKSVRVTIRGKEVEGKLSFINKIMNPKSRTFDMEIKLPKLEEFLLGEAVHVNFILGRKLLHRIPTSALIVNDEGILGVKSISKNKVIVFQPVSIVKVKKGYAVVDGLDKVAKVVTRGFLYAVLGEMYST